MNLDFSPEEFKKYIQNVSDLLERYYEGLDREKVFAGKTPGEVRALFDEPLPEDGETVEKVLGRVENEVLESVTNSAGPHYYGYITGGGNHVAVLAEMIKASLNQNNLKWHSSPASTELEKLVMRWVAEFIGYPSDSAGVLLSGGSVANHNCLAVARKIKSPVDIAEEGVYNAPPMTVYVSSEGHSSFDKAMDMLGLGKKYLRKVPVDEDLCVDVEALDKQISRDKNEGFFPICAVAVAGTTNSGAVDDMEGVAEVCQKHDLWFHIDAAYGGPAAKVNGVSHLFKGVELGDSVVVNPHKWLYVPFEAGGLLVKDPDHLRTTFSTIPDYLKSDRSGSGRTDLMEYNLPLTKEFKALKVWMTLKTYGARRLREAVKADIDKAAYLADQADRRASIELMAPAPLSIACFRYNPGGLREDELDNLNDKIIDKVESDGRIFLTGTKIKGRTALRTCFINHRSSTRNVEFLLDVVEEIGKGMKP